MHFLYITRHPNGKYYGGRHTTDNLYDGYYGSGKWIRSIKDKTILSREVISMHETYEELLIAEKIWLEENIGKPGCMNFNNQSCGFASGSLNPAHTEEEKKRRSIRFSGENNPAKRPEVREKMSMAQKGKIGRTYTMSEEGKKNISNGRTGIKYSEEGRKKLSESRKKQYLEGTRYIPTNKGKKHTPESKEKMRQAALKRWEKRK